MASLNIVNLKCGGCANTIRTEMAKNGMTDIDINIENQTVAFSGKEELARKILTKLGYPPADSPEAARLSKKARSYLSCAIGKIRK